MVWFGKPMKVNPVNINTTSKLLSKELNCIVRSCWMLIEHKTILVT